MAKQKEIDSQKIRIKLADGTKVFGNVNINRGLGYDRLSDLVATKEELILVVVNAQIYEDGPDNPIKLPTVFINKQHILWSTPVEDE